MDRAPAASSEGKQVKHTGGPQCELGPVQTLCQALQHLPGCAVGGLFAADHQVNLPPLDAGFIHVERFAVEYLYNRVLSIWFSLLQLIHYI